MNLADAALLDRVVKELHREPQDLNVYRFHAGVQPHSCLGTARGRITLVRAKTDGTVRRIGPGG